MTIQSNVSKIAYTGAGTTGPFPIPWLFYADTDLTVKTTVTATGVIATLVRNVDYTLTGAGNDAGGSLTLTNVLASTSTITIDLTPPLTQLSEYVSGQDFPSETLEEDLDREVQIAQRLQAQINLAIKAPDSEVAPVMTLPAVAVRANQFAAFDASGNIIVASGIGTDSALRTDLGNTTTAGKGNELISYRRTPAEIAQSIFPVNYYIPSHDIIEGVDLRRYGGKGDDIVINDTAWAAALLVAAVNDLPILIGPDGTWKFTVQLATSATTGRRFKGFGRPTLKFYGLSSSTDCIVLDGGVAMAQIEFGPFYVDANNTGRDGVVVKGTDLMRIDTTVANSVRDAFVLSVAGTQWIEKADIWLYVIAAGRHAVRQELAGAGGSFINEILWRQFVVRGVAKNATNGAGGQAMRLTSTASSGASKFSNQFFLKSNLDAGYTAGGGIPVPSSNVIECDSGTVENFKFTEGGWENTGATSLASGYAWAVSGAGAWNGLTVDSLITNAYWGTLGVHASINAVWHFDFSFGTTRLSGPLKLPTNPAFRAYLTTNTAANLTGDGTAANLAGYTEEYDRANNSNAGTGVFTTPQAGIYEFTARVSYGPVLVGHTVANLALDKNGGAVVYQMAPQQNSYGNADGSGNTAIQGSIQLLLAVNDTIALRLTVSGSTKTVGIFAGTTNTWLCGRLVG